MKPAAGTYFLYVINFMCNKLIYIILRSPVSVHFYHLPRIRAKHSFAKAVFKVFHSS